MNAYPALFERNEKGGFVVSFPDLPGCFTEGDTEVEAMTMAVDAMDGYLGLLRSNGEDVPVPSPLSGVAVPPGGFLALVPVPGNDPEPIPVRISVSINQKLLTDIDRRAKREGMTRSGFLAAGARQLLRQLQE
ncbi:ribbon-helix-helix protein, CopG family [Desulfovibrio sulfodismutans]|uniref:Ribbon-helix-helix protein, CopG family n=1 Tax=Desulfolutivibrio sulfodismutans TaxID=63561 RepID=A0A7K3NR70_9BACT|nr:type II toxin-antitoxin system HicB family antitoxin [Desulfolutivibrio sulfodismutans]NDY58706.1 ribbon-helix-helix protein, CopG family [Desulfolutivibrio sulfodismutans]QLA12742.1 ribbon-helix-helix protein, CopG family [Desulfolutivibrio sulfodismutans DSM 3696]